jgi:hypothetical protein
VPKTGEVATLSDPGLSSPLDLAGGGAALETSTRKPGNVIDLAERREVAKRRDWLVATWHARRLPRLNDGADQKAAWVRAATYSKADLELGLAYAEHCYRNGRTANPWTYIFAKPERWAQVIEDLREKAPLPTRYQPAVEVPKIEVDPRYEQLRKLEEWGAEEERKEKIAKWQRKIDAVEGKLGSNVQRKVKLEQGRQRKSPPRR